MSAFRSARANLSAAPEATLTAFAASALAPLFLVALLPVVYLFVDHLVWKGHVPAYRELPAAKQAAFRTGWEDHLAANKDVDAVLGRVRPARLDGFVNETTKWEWRWQAANYHTLKSRVSEGAANAYLTLPETDDKMAVPTGQRLGVLSALVRERPRWTHSLLATFARTCGWTWKPDPNEDANPDYLTGLFLIAIGLTAAFAGLLLAAEYSSALAALAAVGKIRRAVFAHANRLGVLAVKPEAAGEAGVLLTDRVHDLERGLRAWLTSRVRGPVQVLLVALFLLAVQPWLALAFLFGAAVVWVVGGQIAAHFRREGRAASRRADARLAQMRESLAILPLVKAYLMERFNQTRSERQLTDFGRTEWRRLRGQALSVPAFTGVVLIAAASLLYLSGRSVIAGEFSVAGLFAKACALVALIPAVRDVVTARAKVRKASEAAADVREFLDRRAEPGQPIDAEFLQPMAKKLEFVDVSYREPGTGRMIVENLTISVPVGARIGIAASDAASGQAVAFLLTRFLEPTAGEIKIDGKNLRWVTQESLRTQVALVLRDCLTFNDTVANNLACGDPAFTLPRVIDAAKLAHAHQFVSRLPYGYETNIGDTGVGLKPGEELRLAVARAVLRDPSVIVIDEQDMTLDSDTKALLEDTLERLRVGRTVIVLSRRPSVLKTADQVFVLHHGRLTAAGTHAELMASSDAYRAVLFQESVPVTG